LTEIAGKCYKSVIMEYKGKSRLSVNESASYIGKSTKTVRRYIKQGTLPCERVSGKFGPEIRISKKALDSLLKRLSTPSRPEDEPLEMLRLYRKASPEIRELVGKILRSNPQEDEKNVRGGFLWPFFGKKGGEE
jgi:excisionase family DNA binding protein